MLNMDGIMLIKFLWGMVSYKVVLIIVFIIEVGDVLKVQGKVVGVMGWMVKFFDFFKLFVIVFKVLG